MSSKFIPRTKKEVFNSLLEKKREMVGLGETEWTSESPSDFGIGLLSLVSSGIADVETWIDARLKQAYLCNASNREPVYDGARVLGYVIADPAPAVCLFNVTSTAATELPASSVINKTLSDGSRVKFTTLARVVFSGAETKEVYAIQGIYVEQEVTCSGEPYQTVYVNSDKVALNTLVLTINGIEWSKVSSLQYFGGNAQVYTRETTYSGRPILIFGDGIYGFKPPQGAILKIGYYQTEGAFGNIPPGGASLAKSNSNISTVTNLGVANCELLSDVSASATEVSTVDDGSILSFTSSGVAYIGEDSFTYTNISGNTFEGVVGLSLPHTAGESIVYSLIGSSGKDREPLPQIRKNAIRFNKIKTSANSLKDYARLARRVSGVARASSYSVGNTVIIQIVPSMGEIPTEELLYTVHNYIDGGKNARHILKVVPPKYVYVDMTLEVSLYPGLSFNDVVTPAIHQLLQTILSPVSTFTSSDAFTAQWGTTITRSSFIYAVMRVFGVRYITKCDITEMKRSTDASGTNNTQISLASNEISNIGTITIVDVSADKETSNIVSTIGIDSGVI